MNEQVTRIMERLAPHIEAIAAWHGSSALKTVKVPARRWKTCASSTTRKGRTASPAHPLSSSMALTYSDGTWIAMCWISSTPQAPCSTSTNTTTPPVQTNREFLKGDTDEPTAATMGPDQAVTRIAFKLSWIEKSRPEWSPPEPSSRV